MSWLSAINALPSFLNFSDLFTDPFILEVFISNQQHPDAPVGFKVKNTTKFSLKTDITITPIVNDVKYFDSAKEYNIVLNPGEKVECGIEGDYQYIRYINAKHALNADSYENNLQPLKFELRACFRNNKIKVLKISRCTTIFSAYHPQNKSFSRIE